MRKLLEIEIKDEVKKAKVMLYAVGLLTFSLFFLVRTIERSYFDMDFYVELICLIGLVRFYTRAQRNKNYAFWGFSFLIGLYLLKNILYFTFIDYNIFILYFAFMATLFLGVNSYVMSSPLYYPRLQWWEYDFRYRGELKGVCTFNGNDLEARVADLRRNCTSIQVFGNLPLGSRVKLEIPHNDKIYNFSGVVKTSREVIPGRPISYGLMIDNSIDETKTDLTELMKIWKLHKKANLRKKFSDIKASSNAI
jgi:hypothetical protein